MEPTRAELSDVTRAMAGDHDAFAALANANVDRMYALARAILRDTDRAEDATQDALVRAWRELPHLRDPSRFHAWLRRLLVNACYDEGKKRRIWKPNLRALHDDEHPAPDDLSQVHDRDQLERGFRRLSIDHRAVVVLHTYMGLSLDEVADTLGVPAGTVRSRLHYAVRALRAALDADERSSLREAAQ